MQGVHATTIVRLADRRCQRRRACEQEEQDGNLSTQFARVAWMNGTLAMNEVPRHGRGFVPTPLAAPLISPLSEISGSPDGLFQSKLQRKGYENPRPRTWVDFGYVQAKLKP